MQLNRFAPATVLLLLLLATPTAHAGEPGDGQTTVSTQVTGYVQVDSGGIPQVDEDMTVIEGIILLDADVGEHDRVTLHAMGDIVTSASMRREHNKRFRALQSGASGTIRGQGALGWLHRFGDLDVHASAGGGGEYAYSSFRAGGGLTGRLFENNTTLSVNFDAVFDTVAMIRFNGSDEPDDSRQSFTTSLGWTQILTPDSLLTLEGAFIHQTGFLAGQFNSVFVSGVEDYEVLPDLRNRGSVTLRYKHHVLDRDAIELGGRYYADDWGIRAGTADVRYVHGFSPSLLLEGGYRLHLQGAADAYKSAFSAAQTFQTSDPDLGDFMGHLVELRLQILDPETIGPAGDWTFGVSVYHRDNGLDMVWLTIGTTFGL